VEYSRLPPTFESPAVLEEKIKMWKVNGWQMTDAKWWQKLILPLARWAKKQDTFGCNIFVQTRQVFRLHRLNITKRVTEWLLSSANSAIFQLYHGENRLILKVSCLFRFSDLFRIQFWVYGLFMVWFQTRFGFTGIQTSVSP
jgi:hypothetical protein